jgi:predicted GIY-YIG superfamily endonuclease
MAEAANQWFCYMIECSDGSLYVGSTVDPGRRLKEHNWGIGSRHTSFRRPVKLVWQEQLENRSLARKREAELKGWRREKKLALIAGHRGIHPSP